MGWPEGIVARGVVAAFVAIWRFANGKVDRKLFDTIQKERAGAIREVKEILNKQAECLVAIKTHLANIDGQLAAQGSPGQNPTPAQPSDLIEL